MRFSFHNITELMSLVRLLRASFMRKNLNYVLTGMLRQNKIRRFSHYFSVKLLFDFLLDVLQTMKIFCFQSLMFISDRRIGPWTPVSPSIYSQWLRRRYGIWTVVSGLRASPHIFILIIQLLTIFQCVCDNNYCNSSITESQLNLYLLILAVAFRF